MSSNLDHTRCAYILLRKNRQCRMLVKKGNLYCGEHAIHDENNLERIPCPNDSKHTVAKSELTQHLKRCNSRISLEPWIVEGINAIVAETKYDAKIDRRPSMDEIVSALAKIEKCYNMYKDSIKTDQRHCSIVEQYVKNHSELGDSSKKHIIQQSSIIGHMLDASLLTNDSSSYIVELGAGKAQLAYWMAKVAPNAQYLLVDRSGSRNKYDNKALHENPELNIKRLRCSVEHLNISKVDQLKNAPSLCTVCKHFCGSATDAGIRCLLNGVDDGLNLKGFVLVPCCHHKSRFDEYCGRPFLSKWDMDSHADFCALRHIATWSICGIRKTKSEAETHGSYTELKPSQIENNSPLWSPHWKATMGLRAKAILEIGRAERLASLGFETRVIEYVPTSISPENLLILGLKRM